MLYPLLPACVGKIWLLTLCGPAAKQGRYRDQSMHITLGERRETKNQGEGGRRLPSLTTAKLNWLL
jgi:hypothetical protein